MAPRAPVFYYLSSPCICCCIASNVAFLNAHRIPGVKQTLVCHSLAEVIGNNGRLTNCYHVDLIYFKDPVHLLHRENDPTVNWDSSARKARARTAWRNRDVLPVRQFHQLCNLLFVLGSDYDLRHVRILFSRRVTGEFLYLLNLSQNISVAKNLSQLPYGFGGHLFVFHVNFLLYH